jgi:hypothetical protein
MGAGVADNMIENLKRLILDNTRPWNGFWAWRDKPVGERGAAQKILQAAGFNIERLVSRERDPPDCEAMLDGKWSGIEVTELVDQPTLDRSIKAILQRAIGVVPKRREAHFVWEREDLLEKLRRILKKKDQEPKDHYERYVLVINTDEMYLDRERVARFLEGATFKTNVITDAVLGLSYHPSIDGSGCYPVFRLDLVA